MLADRLDRRRLAVEAGLGGIAVLLAINAALPRAAVWPLYAGLAAATMALAALQRASLDASVPRIVPRDQLAAASALLSLVRRRGMIAGFAGGALAAGPGRCYAADAVSFAASDVYAADAVRFRRFVLLACSAAARCCRGGGARRRSGPGRRESAGAGLRYARGARSWSARARPIWPR